MSNFKATVLMAVYNTDLNYLNEAIESILNQTYKNFEFIIVNDGSNKETTDFLNKLCDPRINLIHNEKNMGLIYSSNLGFEKAKGEYVLKMDSDDISHPTRLKKQIEFLDNNPQIDILGTAFEKFPKTKIIIPPKDDKDIKYTLRFLYNPLAHPTVAIRKSTIEKLNMQYNPKDKICEDYGMWLNYIDDVNFANLEDVLLKYRWHGNNISKKKTDIQSAGAQRVMFEAQGKHFNIDTSKVVEIINKFIDQEEISSSELEIINDFATQIKNNLGGGKYELNRAFYKRLLKKCKHDFNFIKIVFSKQTKNLIKLDLFFKIITILGF